MESILDHFGAGRKQQHRYYQYGSRQDNAPIIAHRYESTYELFTETKPISINYNISPDDAIQTQQFKFSFKRLCAFVGPAWLMSIAYMDSGNLESMIQAGSSSGYSLLWVLWWSTVCGWMFQCLCLRLATVTGQSLSELCRYEYTRSVSIMIWICIELSIIGSDIQQVIGTAIAFNLLFGLKLWIGCILAAVIAFILLAINSHKGLRCTEYFFLSVIATMSILFIVLCFISEPDVLLIFKGWIVPLINDSESTYVQEQAIGIVGAVIMPFNLFFYSSLIPLRNIERNNINAIKEANFYFSMEAAISLLISFVINLCVLSVFASGFYENAEYDDVQPGLLTAGYFLNERFGSVAKWIWALGLLCSGQSATMTGTYAGQFIMNGFLNLQCSATMRTLLTRSIALIPSLFVAVFASDKFDTVNEWLNMEQSIILPFALLPLLLFSCNTRIMGTSFVLSLKMQIVYGIIGVIVVFVSVYLVCLFIAEWNVGDDVVLLVVKWVILSVFVALYLGFICWALVDFIKQKGQNNGEAFEGNDFKMHVDNVTHDEEQSIPLLSDENQVMV